MPDCIKPSVVFAIFALIAGLASAFEWLRASRVKPTPVIFQPVPPPMSGPEPLPEPEPTQPGRKPVSVGGLDDQARASGQLNSRAALYSGIGVIFSAIASMLGAYGH